MHQQLGRLIGRANQTTGRDGPSTGHGCTCVYPIILANEIEVSRCTVTGSDPSTPHIRVWGAPFRAGGGEEKGRAYLVDARRRQKGAGEDVAGCAPARPAGAARNQERGRGERERRGKKKDDGGRAERRTIVIRERLGIGHPVTDSSLISPGAQNKWTEMSARRPEIKEK